MESGLRPFERPEDRELLALRLFGLLGNSDGPTGFIDQVLSVIKEQSGYDAVIIHLNDGTVASAYSVLQAEETDRRAQDMSDCAAYGSVAFVPIQLAGDITGFLQLCDLRKDMFSLDTILFFEEISTGIGNGLERMRSMEALLRANAELERFASAVAHDLKNPLSAACLAGQMLQELLDETFIKGVIPELGQHADMVNRNLSRATMLVESMLAMAKTGQKPERISDVDVAEVLAVVLEEQAPEIDKKGMRVLVDEDLGHVRANTTHVYQVFSNLLSNAIKHNDSESPVVEVRWLTEESGGQRYLVRDNGSRKCSRQGWRALLPLSRKASRRESGIGLTTIETILGIYGGELFAYTDRGTCFEVFLPDFNGEARPGVEWRFPEKPGAIRPAA